MNNFMIHFKKNHIITLIVFCILGFNLLNAQTTQLAKWDFAGSNTTPVLATGISAASISAGGSLQISTALTNSFLVTNMTAANEGYAYNGNGTVGPQYISITITPATTYAIDITNVAIQGYSENKARNFKLSYVNPSTGVVTNVLTSAIIGSTTNPITNWTFDLTSASAVLTGLTVPLELRIYIYGSSAVSTEYAGFGEQAGYDLVINGNTHSPVTQILPGSWSTLGNTISTGQILGSINNEDVKIYSNNTERLSIGADGLSKITGTFKANMLVAYPSSTSIDGAFSMYGTADVNSVYTGPNMNFNFNGKISSGGRMVLQEHMTPGDANPLSNYGRMLLSNNIEWDATQAKYHFLDVSGNADLQMLRYENHGGMAFYTRNQLSSLTTPNETLPSYMDQTTLDQKYRRMSITGHGTVVIGNQATDVIEVINASNQNDKLRVYGDTKLYGDLYMNDLKMENLWLRYPGINNQTLSNQIYIFDQYNVGIGIFQPSEKLEVNGNLAFRKNYNGIVFYDGSVLTTAGGGSIWEYTIDDNNNYSTYVVKPGIKVGIGTTAPAYLLDVVGTTGQTALNIGRGNLNVVETANISNLNVSGTTKVTTLYATSIIHAKEVRVCGTPASNCPDYVFEKNYKLRTLQEVEKYVNTFKHLPEVPSAKEIENDGMGVTEMNFALLKKIEELTLYTIELEKKVKKMDEFEKRIKSMENNLNSKR